MGVREELPDLSNPNLVPAGQLDAESTPGARQRRSGGFRRRSSRANGPRPKSKERWLTISLRMAG